jgi:hypothetical protein
VTEIFLLPNQEIGFFRLIYSLTWGERNDSSEILEDCSSHGLRKPVRIFKQ